MKRMNFLIFSLIIALVLNTSCLHASKRKTKKVDKIYYIAEKDLPRRVAILSPFFVKKVSPPPFASGLIRGVIQNYLVGKGFFTLPLATVDAKVGKGLSLKTFFPAAVFKKLPDADGLVTITVYQLSRFNILLAQYYKIDVELCFYNRAKKLGCWREKARRRKVSIAADPLGAIAAVVSSAVTDTGDIHIKNAVFEWAFKVSSLMPGFSEATKKPKILRLVTNIAPTPFKLGDRIMVGLEGDAGLNASFDLGEFKKGIGMTEAEPGIYKGMYVVQEGDRLKNGILVAHLRRPDGQTRDWIETSPLITIDGCPPEMAQSLSPQVEKDAIKLGWHTEDVETVGFLILRSESPLSGYKEIAQVSEFSYEDKAVEPGKTYFYRVIALDEVGNRSKPAQCGPVALPVLTEQTLLETLIGTFSAGRYLLAKTTKVPIGTKAQIGPSVNVMCGKEAKIMVEGELDIKNAIFNPKKDSWVGIEVMPSGRLLLQGTTINGAKKIVIKGGASFEKLTLKGGKVGLLIATSQGVKVKDSMFTGLDKAIRLEDGKISITGSRFEENELAIEILNGQAIISENNFWKNKLNVKSDVPLILKKNYMGSTEPGAFLIEGKVEVKSILTSPYPQGEEQIIEPEKLKKQAEKLRNYGIAAINKGEYGKAYELLGKALKTWPEKETYIYFIYTLSALGEDAKLKQIVKEALQKYPYEIRIYQISVRYYLQTGQRDEAKRLLQRGLKLNPHNPTLEAMLPLVEMKEEEGKEND